MSRTGNTKEERMRTLRNNRELLIEYLRLKIDEADWHAVADAAMDLRDLEAELRGLEHP